MAMRGITKFQIGKNGLTDGVIESLHLAFKTRKDVRVSVLKSAARDREKIKEMAEELAKRLEDKEYSYKYKIMGFTIILRRSAK